MKSLINSNKKRGDIFVLIIPVFLALFGLLMVYSASNYQAKVTYNDSFFYVKKQAFGIIFGLILMFICSKVDYLKLQKFYIFGAILGIILLLLVLTPLGVENYGAKRWIGVFGITIQPSEITKFLYVLFVASYYSKYPEKTKTFLGLLPVLIVGGIICFLIMLEPNMSITVCVGMVMLILLFSAGVKLKYMFLIIVPLLVLAPLLIILEPYRLKRLMAFINPWASPKGEGYQLIQSLYALGGGGFFGLGLFNSRQKYRFLPFAESDFILSVIGEEFGFLGTFLLFLIMLILVIKGYKIAGKSQTFFGYLMAIGITSIFAVQAVVNALVVTGSIPPTGLPLPLISSGNTSIIVFMGAFGLLYSISKRQDKI